jgi:hypothetical protein
VFCVTETATVTVTSFFATRYRDVNNYKYANTNFPANTVHSYQTNTVHSYQTNTVHSYQTKTVHSYQTEQQIISKAYCGQLVQVLGINKREGAQELELLKYAYSS